jgi:hypothetical protein
VWSLGGWNGGGGVDWVLPRDADIRADGVTVIADSRLPSLVLIDSDGSLRWTIGREGSGPGDFQRPAFVGFRGDSIWVWDNRLSRITWFDIAGNVLETRPLTPEAAGAFMYRGGEVMDDDWILEKPIAWAEDVSEATPPQPVMLRSPSGELRRVDELEVPSPMMAARPMRRGNYSYGPQFVTAEPIVRSATDGDFFFILERKPAASPSGEIVIRTYRVDGRERRRVIIPYQARKGGQQIRDSIRSRFETWLAEDAAPSLREQFTLESSVAAYWVPERLPPATDAFADSEGFWIGREVFRTPRMWERYDREGTLLHEVPLSPDVEVLAASHGRLVIRTRTHLNAPVVRMLKVQERDGP